MSAPASAAVGGAGAKRPPSASLRIASGPMPRSSLSAPNRMARGVASSISHAADWRRRSASNTRPPMAARSPEPAKRWARPQSFNASAAGRRRASMSPSTSIAAERRAPGVMAERAPLPLKGGGLGWGSTDCAVLAARNPLPDPPPFRGREKLKRPHSAFPTPGSDSSALSRVMMTSCTWLSRRPAPVMRTNCAVVVQLGDGASPV